MTMKSIKKLKKLSAIVHNIGKHLVISELYWRAKEFLRYTSFGSWYHCQVEDKFLYPLRAYFNPRHKAVRKSIPNTWVDSDYLIIHTNFAIIREFMEDEFNNKMIDWKHDKAHRDFAKWLKSAYKYITVERPKLEKQMNAAYPKKPLGLSKKKKLTKTDYQVVYGKVEKLEKLIDHKDTELLQEYISKRGFFWT